MKKWTSMALFCVIGLFICHIGGCREAVFSIAPETTAKSTPVAVDASAVQEEAGSGFLETAAARADTSPELPAGPQPLSRLVIYVGSMAIVVQNISSAMDSIQETATSMGGFMQEMGSNRITIKVPAARFEEAIDRIERLGEVTRKEIKGSDVTEEMRDLRIRLDNAEEFRKRLLKLYDRASRMDDLLKIEKELQRITETVETLKGKIQYLEHNVSFSTLHVQINSPMPQRIVAVEIPFEWVRKIGEDVARSTAQISKPEIGWFHRIKVDMPPSYVIFYRKDYQSMAMSADKILIKVRRHDNYQGGSLDFWQKLVRRQLVEGKAFSVSGENKIGLDPGGNAMIFTSIKEIGRQPFGYIVAVAASEDYVYTYEAWGLADNLEADRAAIEKSIKSMEID